jgi:acyl transferase domain-containing protein/NADP-dependent 3-hydroxy acid dehydrogenase YdfG/acyl carrier protein
VSEQHGIAVIGLAGRFPGAADIRQFWQNVCEGVVSIETITDDELRAAGVAERLIASPHYVRSVPRLAGLREFDAEFFGYTAREAAIMDPQHRLFLQTAWEALESAGYDAERYPGEIGVFAGASTSAYLENIYSNLDHGESIRGENVGLAFELAFLTARVSHKLGLRGPSFPVQTACSTALVAVHTACQSLLNYECDTALAGAVAYKNPENTGYLHHEGGFLSPDGQVRPFDADARGTVFGSGVGAVVLKRVADALADRDTILAVIKGSAVNNDGAVRPSFTAPSASGQAAVIAEALAVADVPADTVDYVEAHGSGTRVGDSIEVAALVTAYDGASEIALGSVKGNVGHLDAAAGIAGLIKTVLALAHRTLPASGNYARGDEDIRPFRVQERTAAWERRDHPRRAGVSAFGFGGTNAHVILEEPPAVPQPAASPRNRHLLVLSARSAPALDATTERLADVLRRDRPPLADVAHTLALGRREFPFRRTVTAATVDEAGAALVRAPIRPVPAAAPRVVFLYPGQGVQFPGMGSDLYATEDVYRAAVDECLDLIDDPDLCALVRGDDERVHQTRWAQPALFILEYALTQLFRSWGVRPAATLGHSLGEYVSATVAGVFDLADALSLVVLRGKLMQRLPAGRMLAVLADRDTVTAALPDGLSLAAVNGPGSCVVSGGEAEIESFAATAARLGLVTRPLATSHAFHSPLMRPMVDEFRAALAAVPARAPAGRYVGNLDGGWVSRAPDPDYWVRHLLAPVEFAAGLTTVTAGPDTVVVEVGPGSALAGLAARAVPGLSAYPGLPDPQATLGHLWCHGLTPDWSAVHPDRRRVPLPGHTFLGRTYWLDKATPPAAPGDSGHPLLDSRLLRSAGQSVFGTTFSIDRHWVLSEHRLLGAALVPGTTYLEMARAAGTVHFGRPVTEIGDVNFLVPLLVPDGETRTVHLTVRDIEDGVGEFTVASEHADGWITHATGRVGVGVVGGPASQDLAALRAAHGVHLVDTGARQSDHQVMTFGRRWVESLPTVAFAARAAIGSLHLPVEFHDDLEELGLHPALLDLATGFSAYAVLDGSGDPGDGEFFLPVGYERLRWYAPIPADATSFIRPHADFTAGSPVRKVDVSIYDSAGAVVVDITGFSVKRVDDPRRMVAVRRPGHRHHHLRWVPAEEGTDGAAPRDVLILAGSDDRYRYLATMLRGRGADVTVIAEAGDLDRLDRLPPEVLHIPDPAPDDGSTSVTADGLTELFRVVRGYARRGAALTALTVVGTHAFRVTGDEKATAPGHAALFGLAKVVAQESVDTEVRCLDVEPATTAADLLAILGGPRRPGLVAVRDGVRFVQELDTAPVVPEGRIDRQGFLITGGFGGLGLSIARHLARTVPGARIALVGRTPVPPRTGWDDETDPRRRARLDALREIMAGGADLTWHVADVADAAAMRAVVDAVRRDQGRIDCVIHAAGVAGDGFILRKDVATFEATVRPKATGAVVLDEVTADDPPLLVMFGSTVSVFGAAGQSDYTAANAFLDAFAESRNARGRDTISIRWTDWLDVGMAADHHVEADQGFFRSIGVEDALRSFDGIVAAGPSDIIVGEVNLDRPGLAETLASSPVRAAGSLRGLRRAGKPARQATLGPPAVRLSGRDEYSATETQLAGLWARELGLTEMDVDGNFFSLGADSLVALKMGQNIERFMGVRVSMADLFLYLTVADLAAHIDRSRTEEE